jgi:DNA-directed RNA polymerase subunit RPC12/RpoP
VEQPFSITCTTCKSRLKVRSTAAIGQVVPCPKCGGMVLVKAPEEAVPPEVASAATKPVEPQASTASPHNTKDFDDVESILAGKQRVPAEIPPPAERAAAGHESASTAAMAPAGKAARAAIPREASPAAAGRAPQELAERAAAGDLAALRPLRYGMWLAISILAGIGLAVGVVVVSTWLLRDDGDQTATGSAVASATSNGKPEPAANEKPKGVVSPAEQGDVPAAEETPSADPPAAAKNASDTTPPAIAKSPARSGDPLEIVDPPKTAAKTGKTAPAIGDDPLGKFAEVVGGRDNPLPMAEAPPAAPEKSPAEPPPEEGPARPALPRPPPRNVNVAARLADPLTGIESPGTPLADFLQTISDLSTIPITLELEGLAYRALSPSSPVKYSANNTTVGKALEEALRPLQLTPVVVDDQLVVTLAEPPGGVLINYPMEDLTGRSEQQAQQLAQWATALVEPGSWKDDEEEGPSLTPGVDAFAVQAPQRTHAGLFFLCEKLRIARGLPPKSKHDAALFRLQTRTAKSGPALPTPITLNYSQPTLLAEILRRLGETAKVRILVDWQALAALGWNPDGEGTLVVEGKPLSEALSSLLAPMDLAWRAVDEQTLQVTSAAVLEKTPELEIHPAGDLAADAAAGDALLARLRGALAIAEEEASGFALRFDPASRSILASLPQPRQRDVERLLAEWVTEAKAAAK